ncbi:MAG: Hsp20/alpha crystallin family protein [Candidatus Syntropharchaeia archaeon]
MKRNFMIDLFQRGLVRPGWSINGDLEPLAEIEEREDRIIIMVDLPNVRKEDIEVHATEDAVEISAKMSQFVEWKKWGSIQREITFKSFRKYISLPSRIDPGKAEAIFRKGILKIELPKMKERFLIGIK